MNMIKRAIFQAFALCCIGAVVVAGCCKRSKCCRVVPVEETQTIAVPADAVAPQETTPVDDMVK